MRPIIVLGVDRSGTSLLTDVLSHWGCYAGDPRLLAAANPFNPQGFWEYIPIQQFLFELFDTAGTGWWNAEFRPALQELGRSPTYRRGAQRLMAEMEVAGKPYVWKEPYFSVSLPFWKQVLVDPVYLVTLRNPYRSALSYQNFLIPTELRGRFRTIAFFLLRWQFFMRCILEDMADADPIFVVYEELVSSPLEECRRISARLDRALGIDDEDPGKPGRMAARIDPKLWRQRSQLSLDEILEASQEQRDLYAYMMRRAKGAAAEDLDLSRFPMPACWPEYAHNIESLREVLVRRGLPPKQEPDPAPEERSAQPPAAPPAAPPRFPPRRRRDAAARSTEE